MLKEKTIQRMVDVMMANATTLYPGDKGYDEAMARCRANGKKKKTYKKLTDRQMLLRLRKDHDELTDNFVEVADQRNEVAKQLQETLANWKETTALLERTSTDYKNWKEEDKEWRKTFGNRVIELVSPLLDKEAVEKLKHLIYDTKPKADLQ